MKIRNKDRKQWIWFLGFIVGFIVILIGLYARMVSVRKSAFEAEKEERLAPVRTQPALPTEVWRTESFLGRIEGGQTISVRTYVSGTVIEKKAVRGEEVRQNESLIVLEDERKILSLKEADARLKSARADLEELRRKYKQTQTLEEKGIVARDTLLSLSNQVEAESAQVDALEAVYNRAKWGIDQLEVKAPINGRIVEILPDLGQEVLENEVVANMVNTSTKRVIAGVDARWARLIQPGLAVNLTNSLNGKVETAQGQIVGVSPDMESNSGTYVVEAKIVGSEYDWWPGEVINMQVPVELLKGVIRIPRTAFLSDTSDVFLFVYKDGRALKVPVEVTWLNEREGVVPAHMISKGAEIIIEGQVGLADGERVRVIEDRKSGVRSQKSE